MAGQRKGAGDKEEVVLCMKDQKKVAKLKSKIPYFEARKQQDEVDKLNQQIENVYKKAQEAMNMALA